MACIDVYNVSATRGQNECRKYVKALLPPVLSKIDLLFNYGLEFNTQHGKKVLKAKIVAAVFDFPAKAMVQFNGYYGCPPVLQR